MIEVDVAARQTYIQVQVIQDDSRLPGYKFIRIVSISGRHLAADAMERGEDVTMYASMLKLKVGRLLREVTDACVQFWGGMGYSDDVYVSR